ncbi:uncharacterized protein G2W53_003642 [Senna tora]|uniref:CCHC-type domain-containing protein n=1 Tax=Senna tora TaxID=362788 RepID=A0A834XAI1_9FABA|nr:uncharacterized protein G2W53_003642 [Senna tora]
MSVETRSLSGKDFEGGSHHFSDLSREIVRICVEVDLTKQLVPQVEVRGRTYPVEYKGIHMVCFHCGWYGHTKDHCFLKKVLEGRKQTEEMDLNNVLAENIDGGGGGVETTMADPKQVIVNGKDVFFGERKSTQSTGATRFDILHDLGDQEESKMGSASDTDHVVGSAKGPVDPMIGRSINGKMVVMDKQQWRPASSKQSIMVNRPKLPSSLSNQGARPIDRAIRRRKP